MFPSLPEILVILVVLLIVVGPEKMPEIARVVGNGLREIRRATNMFRDTMMLEDQQGSRRSNEPVDVPLDQGPVDQPSAEGAEGPQMKSKNPPGSVDRPSNRAARMWPVLLEPTDETDQIHRATLDPSTEATDTRTAYVPFPHRTVGGH